MEFHDHDSNSKPSGWWTQPLMTRLKPCYNQTCFKTTTSDSFTKYILSRSQAMKLITAYARSNIPKHIHTSDIASLIEKYYVTKYFLIISPIQLKLNNSSSISDESIPAKLQHPWRLMIFENELLSTLSSGTYTSIDMSLKWLSTACTKWNNDTFALNFNSSANNITSATSNNNNTKPDPMIGIKAYAIELGLISVPKSESNLETFNQFLDKFQQLDFQGDKFSSKQKSDTSIDTLQDLYSVICDNSCNSNWSFNSHSDSLTQMRLTAINLEQNYLYSSFYMAHTVPIFRSYYGINSQFRKYKFAKEYSLENNEKFANLLKEFLFQVDDTLSLHLEYLDDDFTMSFSKNGAMIAKSHTNLEIDLKHGKISLDKERYYFLAFATRSCNCIGAGGIKFQLNVACHS